MLMVCLHALPADVHHHLSIGSDVNCALNRYVVKHYTLAYFLLTALITSHTTGAQQKYQPAPDATGKWVYTYLNEPAGSYRSDANYVLSAAELAAFRKKINAVVEILHSNSVAQHPVGFNPTIQAGIWVNASQVNYKPALTAGRIPVAEIVLRFCILHKETATGNLRPDCMEVEHCDVFLNNLSHTIPAMVYSNHLLSASDTPRDSAFKKLNAVFTAPQMVKSLAQGVTLYDNGVIIAAGTQRPYWLPVTAGELFDLQVRYWTLASKEEGNTLMLDMILEERKSFSEAQLRMPAYYGEHPASLITVQPNTMPYMRLNPAYFDKTIPRTALQLITVKVNKDILVPGFNKESYRQGEHYMDILRYYEFSNAIDGGQLRSLLDVQ